MIIVLFGIPIFLLPRSLENNTRWAQHYNDFHKQPWVNLLREYSEKWLGGTLRLFIQRTGNGDLNIDRRETELYVRANLPAGTTIEKADSTIRRMEYIISCTEGVQLFRTNVSPQSPTISVTFTKEGQQQNAQFILYEQLLREAIQTGNATWAITGVGDGFNNAISTNKRAYLIELSGYNYDHLMAYAEQLKTDLETHQRVQNVHILPYNDSNADYMEYVLHPDKELLAVNRYDLYSMFSSVERNVSNGIDVGSYLRNGRQENIVLSPQMQISSDPWTLYHSFVNVGGRQTKVSGWLALDKRQTPPHITKIDQEYRLRLEYDYLGDYQLGVEVLKETMNSFSKRFPAGYKAVNPLERHSIKHTSKISPYWNIALVILIIYLICTVLFNSLTQPLIIIFTIPISYIGIFVSYVALDIPFNQGGIGAFVLLGGLTCNSAIYLLNDYNNFCRYGMTKSKAYFRAFNGKIVPIMMTLLSTALGLLAFIIDTNMNVFWYSFSVGTISGLVAYMIGLVLYIPLLLGVKNEGLTASI